jgi:hypothetical protein
MRGKIQYLKKEEPLSVVKVNLRYKYGEIRAMYSQL